MVLWRCMYGVHLLWIWINCDFTIHAQHAKHFEELLDMLCEEPQVILFGLNHGPGAAFNFNFICWM